MAGALAPSGRRSQIRGCIRTTVHHESVFASPSSPLAENQAIATLREGSEADGIFACTRKGRQLSRAGSPYLTVELRDSTGTIRGRAFRDADVLAGRFERGGLVHVRGLVESFRDELQLEIRTIAQADGAEAEDLARFLPVARRDLDELDGFLEH